MPITSGPLIAEDLSNLEHQEANREIPEELLKSLLNLLESNYFNMDVNQQTNNVNPGLSHEMKDILQGKLKVILGDINNILSSNSAVLAHVLEDKGFMSNAKITPWFKLFCEYQNLKNYEANPLDDQGKAIIAEQQAQSSIISSLNLNVLDSFLGQEDCRKITSIDSIYDILQTGQSTNEISHDLHLNEGQGLETVGNAALGENVYINEL